MAKKTLETAQKKTPLSKKELKEKEKIEKTESIEREKRNKQMTKERENKAKIQAKIDAKKAKGREKEKQQRLQKREKELQKIRLNKADDPLPDLPRGMSVITWYTDTYKMKYRPNEKSVYTNIKKNRMEDRIKIFLSHPNQDKEVRNKIHYFSDYLRKQKDGKYAPWCDKDYLGKPGRDLTEGLVHDMIQALAESDIVIVGLPEGPVSNWIIAENEQAKNMRKRILIVTFGKAVIREGMVHSVHAGHVNIPNDLEEWERLIIETVEYNIAHNRLNTSSYTSY